MRNLARLVPLGVSVLLTALLAPAAHAALITYDVDLNFDPTTAQGGPGVGTITGTFTIDTSIPIRDNRISSQTGYQPTDVVAVDLVEATNDGQAAIGGAFGFPTYSSFTFDEYQPFVYYFFGSPETFQSSTAVLDQKNYEFNDQPFVTLFFQTDCCRFDGQPVSPTITFDFPYPQGGSVRAGNFDSITSEDKYLFGTVTPSNAPEPTSWALLIVGLGLAGAGLRSQGARRRADAEAARAA